MAARADCIIVQVLGHTVFEKWCPVCLMTATWVTAFFRISTNGQTATRCIRGDHS
jgi:hypothetical protein